MTDKLNSARDLQAHLEQKCAELTARTSALIDFVSAGDDAAFVVAMIEESKRSVEFWADAIVKKVRE